MPTRNLTFLLITAMVSLLCYGESSRNRYVGILSESIDTITENYVEPVDGRKLFEGGLRGMLGELDPYSGYIAPEEYSQFRVEIEQHFGGIGIEVGLENEQIMVLNVVPDTPAYQSGIVAGDILVSIDETTVQGQPLDTAVQLMRGPAGKPVHLTVTRPGESKPLEFTITRDVIRVESIRGDHRLENGHWVYLMESHPRFAHIRLSSFGENTAAEFREAFTAIEPDCDGLIMDLRGNAGGLLSAAIHICEMFLDRDAVIVSTRGREGKLKYEYRSSDPPQIDPRLPVVILVDRFSASASEIVAACLQDHHRATIVGERTWGKGTVQNVLDIEGGRSAIRLTTHTYWRPSGVNIHRHENDGKEKLWGVQPLPEDKVEFTTEEYKQVYDARRQRDYPRIPFAPTDKQTPSQPLVDRQLQRAIQVLEAKRASQSTPRSAAA